MFIAECEMKDRKESNRVDDLLADHYESLPERHQQELLDEYDRLKSQGLLDKKF